MILSDFVTLFILFLAGVLAIGVGYVWGYRQGYISGYQVGFEDSKKRAEFKLSSPRSK